MRDGLKVVWIHTAPDSAQVVNLKTILYDSGKKFVRRDMSI